MQIIAKTEDGFLITAKKNEVTEILKAISGNTPEMIQIGQKLPAIDYALTITKIKGLKEDFDFNEIFERLDKFCETANKLKQSVENAGSIEF